MEITELRIDIPSRRFKAEDSRAALLACFSLVFDEELVVHSVKLIQGKESVFLAMPSEKRHDHCPLCWAKNHLMAKFCSNCGKQLAKDRHLSVAPNKQGRIEIYNDLVHPVTNDLREYLLEECRGAYDEEQAHPGSVLPMLREDTQRKPAS